MGNCSTAYSTGWVIAPRIFDDPSATLIGGRAEAEMVSLGEGWLCDRDRIFHACGPDACIALPDGRWICDCGCLVPRHIRQFRSWLKRGRVLVVTMEPPQLN